VVRSSQTGATSFEDDRGSDGSAWGGHRWRGGELRRRLGFGAQFEQKSDRDDLFYRVFSPYYS
jgi:hypothetical protein